MAKKAARNLVIVESPAKAKTIGKYLGPDYEVRASMGHLRDLPKSKLGVDVEHDFEPNYRPIRGKEELINELKKLSKASDTVYLATDPDREGEAISWHLKNLLDLSDEKAKRVTFNEITRKVVTESIHHPREIDQDLVDAQQARRILDRIVGYELSPLLWKKIRRGLSAGRVQSVAMRLVADREKEIKDFVPQEYWTLDALLKNDGGVPFRARYYGKDGKKYEPVSQEEVSAIQAEVQALPFAVKSVKRTDKQRSPAPPFTTSTMQQDASRKLNMTPRRTMAIAQQLYEGVDITGEGTVGLITYMRTDSLRISDEAQAAARSFVTGRYGAGYCPAAPRQYKTKAGAQDAHEAIRPSDVDLTPERVKSDLTSEQYRLYRLIWSRFLASQMSNAIYDSVSVELGAGAHSFRASASSLKFAGYTAVYEESRDDEKEEKAPALPPLAQGEVVTLTGFDELNMIVSLYGISQGVPQVITKLGHADKGGIVSSLALGSVVCPKELCCSNIVRYVRAMQNQTGAAISVHTIADGQIEAMEFLADESTRFCGVPLKDIKMKSSVRVVSISHGAATEIANGDSVYQQGDTIIVVTNSGVVLRQLNDIFA